MSTLLDLLGVRSGPVQVQGRGPALLMSFAGRGRYHNTPELNDGGKLDELAGQAVQNVKRK